MQRRVNSIIFAVIAVTTAVSVKPKKTKLDLTDVVNPDKSADPELYKLESAEGEDGVIGDIYVGKGSTNRNMVANPVRKWPRGVVPYVWDSSVDTPERRQKFQEAVDEFQKLTCIRFVPHNGQDDYVRIRGKQFHCFSPVGRQGQQQFLTLSEGCYSKATLLHEMMHTLGFHHEHNRSDRDEYITVHMDKLDEYGRPQYQKVKTSEEETLGFPYDYASVMHYGGFDIITTKDKKWQYKIGQRAGFSKQDVQEINAYYNCSGPGGTSGVEGVVIPKPPCEDANTPYCQGLNIVNGNDKWNNCVKDKVTISLCQKSCMKC